MKKIIIALIALMMIPALADAQIVVKEKKTTPVKVATISAGWYDLYIYEGIYMLSLKSTNQFDDHFWLRLGNREEAIVSLTTLIELCDTIKKDDFIEISNGLNKTYCLGKYMKGLSISQKEPGMAGQTYILKTHLEKALSHIM